MSYHVSFNDEPLECPRCGSVMISDGETTYEMGALIHRYDCDSCDFKWIETYVFKEWEPL